MGVASFNSRSESLLLRPGHQKCQTSLDLCKCGESLEPGRFAVRRGAWFRPERGWGTVWVPSWLEGCRRYHRNTEMSGCWSVVTPVGAPAMFRAEHFPSLSAGSLLLVASGEVGGSDRTRQQKGEKVRWANFFQLALLDFRLNCLIYLRMRVHNFQECRPALLPQEALFWHACPNRRTSSTFHASFSTPECAPSAQSAGRGAHCDPDDSRPAVDARAAGKRNGPRVSGEQSQPAPKVPLPLDCAASVIVVSVI